MVANVTIWNKMYKKWQETKDNTLLEYLTCSKSPDINQNYLKKTMEYEFIDKVSNRMYVNIVLLIIAKHARNDMVFQFTLNHMESIKFSSKK